MAADSQTPGTQQALELPRQPVSSPRSTTRTDPDRTDPAVDPVASAGD
ncbi:MAG: hypothetical protein JWM84_26 [Nocardioides sp.]|jgi:hypothetical protein|nr:hypothetical protein [Nocardioides sp.]